MDNLTHSLVGLALGELANRALPAHPDPDKARTRRRVLLATGALASNFPDLDLVLTPLLAPPLGYLLHHRGHTHTLLYALPQIALLLGLLWLLWPGARRLMGDDRPARRAVLATAAVGMVLHLSLDFLNVYGVHPFHPLDSRWLYGDMVFIIEPVFWTALGIALALLVPNRVLRWLFAALILAAPVAFTYLGFLQWGSLAGLLIVACVVAVMARRGGSAGLVTAIVACLGFIAVQGVAGHLAREQIRSALAQLEPGSRILDMPLSAFPSNPLCWSFAAITDNGAAGSYAVRIGALSLAPGVSDVAACPARFGGEPGSAQRTLSWKYKEDGSLAGLRALQQDNCHFDGWLRFARVPSLIDGKATDIRFSAPGVDNFSTLPYVEMAALPCPAPVPQWERPRQDLLDGR
ncbi:metal-dependent hydrolase [Massilia sp. CFBP9026]|uniref:metal-dependent hydrolase n=1 Tax=Massilia sp. CFBP9026 TaxID=3096536 RepID=UPI002A6A58AE|nr:metal-dependent hydrolase [Massilia sp. CFBP9026]MDY0960777.1 metal-dependent hydrolase [Massilia sp. CFBP9026]